MQRRKKVIRCSSYKKEKKTHQMALFWSSSFPKFRFLFCTDNNHMMIVTIIEIKMDKNYLWIRATSLTLQIQTIHLIIPKGGTTGCHASPIALMSFLDAIPTTQANEKTYYDLKTTNSFGKKVLNFIIIDVIMKSYA